MKDIIYKLPQEFLQKLKAIYPAFYPQVANSFLNKKATCFRINYAKGDLPGLRHNLIQQRIKAKELQFPPGAFILRSPLRNLQDADIYQKGEVYVQNLSSMIPVIILGPQNNEKILDLCAAPGAKTTQILSLAPQAEVVAVEKIRTRYYKLLANLKTQGTAEKVKALVLDAIWVRKMFPEKFDRILADVPCSAEGRFFISNPKSFKYWKQRKVKEMAHKQKKLLYSAFFALRQGGEMVYSTCTFSPEENEEIIDWFIEKFKDKMELMPIKIPLPNVIDGLTRFQDKKFSQALRLTKRIIPNENMEGFFVAKLRKISC